jgi:hypothetical protein
MKFRLAGVCVILILFWNPVMSQNRNGAAPDFVTGQYAGSIGYFSIGTGYDIFKHNARVSAHFGTVPKSQGGLLNIVTGKIFFVPKTFRVSEYQTT